MGKAEVKWGMTVSNVLHPTNQQVNLCQSKKWDENRRQVNTWITLEEYELLIQLAQSSKVKLSVYIRAIITDALEDERERAANCKPIV